ncbi:Glyoxalase/bleomycin resistance protein/dioxygenase [[Leptolyngbya] sp. PCC 7376]|uniref:VOC family protein n=1 Tax=[Leptolyngbya] sp. PCC 7376 TaxID=111781 RepID=UPI00029F37DF|nr:VOC family protein [[Leptolyngbya] sp. PCC 7376]AFY37197.1 Glyoxalase/bleomycin resistance protein/dioxygenase [[Leptolyngbya] sp. PCC 7376]
MPNHGKLDYVEFATQDIKSTQQFFERAFAWSFNAFGDDYIAFTKEGLDGGFFSAESVSTSDHGSPLLVFYSENLEATQTKVVDAGGKIIREIFAFPGGRRFHFSEPGGNELAVWSDVDAGDKKID